VETKTVEKGDLFIWNNAVKVKIVRTYKSNKVVNAVCSTLLVEWPAKYSLPLSELFVPVESFDEFNNEHLEEYWGTGGPTEDVDANVDKVTQEDIDAIMAIVDGPVHDESGGELEEFDTALEQGEPVEVIGGSTGSVSTRPSNDDGSTTPEHSDESEVRREEVGGLTSHDPDAT
jgi:hypothetical protein